MTISESNVAPLIVKQLKSDVGILHFFEHMAVVEFNEGAHIDLEAFRKPMDDLIAHFGPTRPFGLVANRINSYSVSLLDLPEIRTTLPNMVAYGIVTHNEAGRMNAIIETNFCEATDICFDNLYEGLDAVYNRVKKKILISLN